MSDWMLLKNKLLTVKRSGIFMQFEPEKLNEYYEEVEEILQSTQSLYPIETFTLLELQFYLSLMTCRDVKAKSILDRISDQFEMRKSQRVKILTSLYYEANGRRDEAIKLLSTNPDELRLSRRLATFSRNAGSNEDYISSLNYFLKVQPSDEMAWAELGDQYFERGNYEEAIFAYKEVLLQSPNRYIFFYRVGLANYYRFLQELKTGPSEKKDKLNELMNLLKNARDNFLRSAELLDSYEKGWAGALIVINHEFNPKFVKIDSSASRQYLKENEKLRRLISRKLKSLLKDEELTELQQHLA